MGLFDIFKNKKSGKNGFDMEFRKQEADSTGYRSPEEQRFWQLYVESLQMKDQARLRSALDKREEALNTACPDRGYEGMALHNLAILTMYHCGLGLKAAEYAKKSLDCGEDYYRCSQDNLDWLQFGAHLESIQTVMMAASSYDEALEYCAMGEKYYPGIHNGLFERKRTEIEEFRKNNPRYTHYQMATAGLYYSRVSQELDQGDYAPAMSLLQMILNRAEQAGYNLKYEEYVDVLDDYTTITIMYLMKKARLLGGPPELFKKELAFIAEEPLKYLADFMPDCEPGDRERFERIIAAFRTFPGVSDLAAFAPFR